MNYVQSTHICTSLLDLICIILRQAKSLSFHHSWDPEPTFVGSYPWSRPGYRSFPNMAPLLNHNQLSWQCHQKELNSSKTPKKTSVLSEATNLILLMVQNSQGQPPGMVQHLQFTISLLQTQICSWPQPAHQPDRGEFLHSAPSQSEPGWDQNQCLLGWPGHLQRAGCEITNH